MLYLRFVPFPVESHCDNGLLRTMDAEVVRASRVLVSFAEVVVVEEVGRAKRPCSLEAGAITRQLRSTIGFGWD